MLKRLFFVGAAIAAAGAAFAYVQGRALFKTWGVDPGEQSKPLPGDDVVPEAEAVLTRGIDIAAPPEKVWPWLVQMGYGRAGWYSYDQLDMNKPSADRIIPELQALAVGDTVPTHPGGGFEVKVLEDGRALVLYADRALMMAQAAEKPEGIEQESANVKMTGMYLDANMRGDFRASWAFVLEPKVDGTTRFIQRFRGWMSAPDAAKPGMTPPPPARTMLLFGIFVMMRRQMIGIRDRAEGRPIKQGGALDWKGLGDRFARA
ncbi:MAG TPA: hypothetical protein VK831_02480 [Candidatus Deferrimicrobiaceae bacterium]|nr:hypothetical protein [Candidatus Deferrimicrobiaceae bacterium]